MAQQAQPELPARDDRAAARGIPGLVGQGSLDRIVGGPHSDNFLMVYLPREKLLIEADAFTPPPPNTPPPAEANANNVNLVDNIERLRLAVDRILPLHGRVVPLSELYTATKRTPR